MIYGVYAMRDVKVGFLTPSVDVNDQTAVRNFVHAVVNSESVLYSHAKDFALYRIGSYDSDMGTLEPQLPQHLYEATDAVRSLGGESDAKV
ncbi:nonstructural protein [Dipodfec virus UOA04_Rod_939]|nr:nonstructural protein [Dipodfec virus UOA04_Rod_939]